MNNDKSWIYGTTGNMNSKPTSAQKRYIYVLEKKTGVRFNGKTKRDAMNYISNAKKREEEYKIYRQNRKTIST